MRLGCLRDDIVMVVGGFGTASPVVKLVPKQSRGLNLLALARSLHLLIPCEALSGADVVGKYKSIVQEVTRAIHKLQK